MDGKAEFLQRQQGLMELEDPRLVQVLVRSQAGSRPAPTEKSETLGLVHRFQDKIPEEVSRVGTRPDPLQDPPLPSHLDHIKFDSNYIPHPERQVTTHPEQVKSLED